MKLDWLHWVLGGVVLMLLLALLVMSARSLGAKAGMERQIAACEAKLLLCESSGPR